VKKINRYTTLFMVSSLSAPSFYLCVSAYLLRFIGSFTSKPIYQAGCSLFLACPAIASGQVFKI